MQKSVTKEGEKEEELYNKFMCYCKTGSADLMSSIAVAKEKIPLVQNNLEASTQLKSQCDGQIDKAKGDRKAAKETLAKATALRNKQAEQFTKDSEELKTNIEAITKAITALEKGMKGSFLQSAAANVLRRLAMDADMSSADREVITSFLSSGDSSRESSDESSEETSDESSDEREDSSYAPQSGQILGILKQMKDTMLKDLADLTAAENQAIKDYEGINAAKNKEVEALNKAIEAKLESSGQLDLEIVEYKEDLQDTEENLAADTKFLAELQGGCKKKAEEWEVRCKVRTNELLAIADTIKMLNDDDALDLFKKTLPSASFLQIVATSKSVAQAAQDALEQGKGGSKDPRLALISLALNGGVPSFEKVLKMIENMIGLLGREQEADDSKREYCNQELDKNEDQKKVLDTELEDLNKAIDDARATVETLTKEIAALTAGIKELDRSVREATENRRAENAEYKETMSQNNAAMEILKMAKNRLAKFYNPKIYKPEALVQNKAIARGGEGAAPPPPPETFGAYKTKTQESQGVLAMMDALMGNLQQDMSESKTEENLAQKTYEDMVAESTQKKMADAKSRSEKEGARADLEARLQKMAIEKKDTAKELYAKELTLKDLHLECDWLLKNFEVRKSARQGEVDSLRKAQAVLEGAD